MRPRSEKLQETQVSPQGSSEVTFTSLLPILLNTELELVKWGEGLRGN